MAKHNLHRLLIALLHLSIFLSLNSSSSSGAIIGGVLNSPSFATSQTKSQWERANNAAYESLSRAQSINSFQTAISTHISSYTISLDFGTPPQPITFLLDLGTSQTWFPCTNDYNCSGCHLESKNPAFITTFIPTQSTSAKDLDCKNQLCQQFHEDDSDFACDNDSQVCPYQFHYVTGSTSGFFLSETLHFDEINIPNVIVGCSIESSGVSTGIGYVAFGREPTSLPSQLGVKMFSYCLVAHKFSDTPKTSPFTLVLEGVGVNNSNSDSGISYTPFVDSPARFPTFYYVTVTKITVGDVDVQVPSQYLVPGPDGNGGTVIEPGTTFTVMDAEVHQLVLTEYEKQMGQYYRRVGDLDLGNQVNFTCYNFSGQNPGNFPALSFYFEGGGKMEFPMTDNFEPYSDVVCLTLLSAKALGVQSGPSITLGNYQQQNIYMEFDLENQRLGFKEQIC
ncbi:OLC1v1034094C1 [Oldenlandia corymbosa var. corymbosa]|uniref:OLC1v1034094C1 n=1 Tax=Oldenlandia corymbosa var. corymbosa TaxID=529605 RepID=A0AAV1CR24_OLDCO|nr:OLC1v1034094C1 [Oldenlandia corymbosa var. corymbosa]